MARFEMTPCEQCSKEFLSNGDDDGKCYQCTDGQRDPPALEGYDYGNPGSNA